MQQSFDIRLGSCLAPALEAFTENAHIKGDVASVGMAETRRSYQHPHHGDHYGIAQPNHRTRLAAHDGPLCLQRSSRLRGPAVQSQTSPQVLQQVELGIQRPQTEVCLHVKHGQERLHQQAAIPSGLDSKLTNWKLRWQLVSAGGLKGAAVLVAGKVIGT